MARYFLELAYKGTSYHGWQVQPNAMSVQAVLEDALNKALRQQIPIVGAGRTDTGVHASYYVAHFDFPTELLETTPIVYKLNRILPNDIVVYSLQKVDEQLHSRFSAVAREYQYWITLTKSPFLDGFSHRLWYEPDFELMNKACVILFQHIDFTSFSKLHTDVKTNNCKIFKAQWELKDNKWVFTIRADRFLRNMVRAIVGTMLEVGRGKMTLAEFEQVIIAKNRSDAGPSVPPEALYLVDIEYPQDLFKAHYRHL